MIQCLKCHSALECRFVNGGLFAKCSACQLSFLSVAHLMRKSDRDLVRRFWDHVLSSDWTESGHHCPRCDHALSGIPLEYGKSTHPVLACKFCYHLVLETSTMQRFEREGPDDRRAPLFRAQDGPGRAMDQMIDKAFQAAGSKWTLQIARAGGGSKFSVTLAAGAIVGCILGLWAFRLASGEMQAVALLLGGAFALGIAYGRGWLGSTKAGEATQGFERGTGPGAVVSARAQAPEASRRTTRAA